MAAAPRSTQESYNKSKSETPKRRRSTKRKKEPQRSKTPLMEAVGETISEGEEQHQDIDVFAFLVENGEEPLSTASDVTTVRESVEAVAGDIDVSARSLHSDSGISMGDGSVTLSQVNHVLPIPNQHSTKEQDTTYRINSGWTWPDVPKPMQPPILLAEPTHHWDVDYPLHHTVEDRPNHSPHPVCFTPDSPISRHPSTSTWDRLAFDLSKPPESSKLPPFRAFSSSSEHVLLDLQQEVSALDAELKRLETYVEPSSHEDGSGSPSDRRGSWQWSPTQYQHPSDLSALRADLSARLHVKLEQYCSCSPSQIDFSSLPT